MISRKSAFDNYMEEINNVMRGGYGGSTVRASSVDDPYSTIRSKESLRATPVNEVLLTILTDF